MKNIYIARQPILDTKAKLYAYEVLYRESEDDIDISTSRFVSAAVISNILNRFGTHELLGGRRAFVKIDEKFLLSDLIVSIPKEFFVFCLLGTIEMSKRVIERIQQLVEKEYILAIEDMDPSSVALEKYLEVMPYLGYVKVDINRCMSQEAKESLSKLRSYKTKVICTKIENEKEYLLAQEVGCDLYQGYFFAKPKIIKNKKCDAHQLGVIKIYNLLLEDADIDELSNEFEKNHVITLQLLRFINSGAFHFRNKISSIRHILTLMGRVPLAQWLLLMIYAKSLSREKENSPLLLMAINRTRLMQNILKLVQKDVDRTALGEAYFVGILSLMDNIFSIELKELLDQMQVSEAVSNALLFEEGTLGELYVLVRNIEAFNTEAIEIFARRHNLELSTINNAIMESMEHVNDFEKSYHAG